MQSKMLGKLPVESKDKFVRRIRSMPTRLVRGSNEQQIKDSSGGLSNQSIKEPGESSKQPIRRLYKIANLKESVPRFGPVYSVKQDAVDAIKEKAWRHVLIKSSTNTDVTKEMYSTAMRQVEQQAKGLYDGKATGIGIEFRWMMIKDGCLCNQIVLHILGCSEQLGYPQNDPIFGKIQNKKKTKTWIEALFYPGNQLPLVVLRVLMNQEFFQEVIAKAKWGPVPSGLCKKVLYELLVLPSLMRTHRRSLIERVGAAFVGGCRGNSGNDAEQPQPQPSDLLDGIRNILMGPASQHRHPTSEDETEGETDSDGDQDEIGDSNERLLIPNTNDQVNFWNVVDATHHNHNVRRIFPSATELKQAGIHIKVLNSGGARGIRYQSNYFRAHIYLPPLPLDTNTKFIFRSLNNYENLRYSEQNRQELILYFKIMSDLIHTARDAKLLQDNGVIHGKFNHVEKLPAMLKRLTTEEDIRLTQEVRILRSQIRDHSSPWVHFKGLLNFVVFLTFVQTFFSVLAYFKPPK